jgi:hypothetical protein
MLFTLHDDNSPAYIKNIEISGLRRKLKFLMLQIDDKHVLAKVK